MKEFTHTGVIKGCDSRTSPDYAVRIDLRETKNFWVSKERKFRKTNGWAVADYPMYYLELSTIIGKQ